MQDAHCLSLLGDIKVSATGNNSGLTIWNVKHDIRPHEYAIGKSHHGHLEYRTVHTNERAW